MSCPVCEIGETFDRLAAEFEGFKAGMYRAMEMLGAEEYYLKGMAGATTRT